MVQGLAFLSKKSWHTKNLSNQEKVWVAEQRKAEEERKVKELAQQIQQEREQTELEQISGKRSGLDRGIDWMYEGQHKDSEIAKEDAEKKAEEYLLGKEYVPEGGIKGDFQAAVSDQGVNAVVKSDELASMPTSYTEPTVAEKNEAFRIRHEDPMFVVTMQAHHKKENYEKKKQLYERVVGGEAVDTETKKKKKKHVKDRSRSPNSSSERGEKRRRFDDKRRNHQSRDRNTSRRYDSDEDSHDRQHRKHSRESESKSHSRRHHRDDRSHDRYSHREEKRRRDRDRREDRRVVDERERSHHDGHSRQKKDYSFPEGAYEHHSRDYHAGEYDRKYLCGDYDPARNSNEGDGKYGLQGGNKPYTKDFGPNQDLLGKRRQERESERRRQKELTSRRRHLTAEEREAALQEMQSVAVNRDEVRRTLKAAPDDEVEREKGQASFLTRITQETHGVDGSTTLADRLAQNRYINQAHGDSSFR